MQATTNTSPTSSTDIYVIFRVSDLGTDSMNLAIYVDPEGMRLDQTLVFATKTYAVTLGPGGNLF